jgi:hypothetical protein
MFCIGKSTRAKRKLDSDDIRLAAAAYLYLNRTREVFGVNDIIRTIVASGGKFEFDTIQVCLEFSKIYEASNLNPALELDAINNLWDHANVSLLLLESTSKKIRVYKAEKLALKRISFLLYARCNPSHISKNNENWMNLCNLETCFHL